MSETANEKFEALVHKLEAEARRNPTGYQFKVLLLAFLGNAYLGAILLLIVALLAGLIASMVIFKAVLIWKIVAVVGVFLFMILKAVWVRIAPPAGFEVTAGQVPDLFAIIDELRHRLGAPRFHHVLISDEFNAGVVQSPRLGIFGLYRNYLLLGLPLMKSLTVEQFKAVLAHEFGHLAGGHGRLSNWIYRQRARWSRLMAILEANESAGIVLFKPFLNWFAPYFNAYSFPLARANEYEADAASARLTSPGAAATALTGVSVVGSYLAERYWPQLHKQADDQPQPGFAPYSSMGHLLAAELDEASVRRWLDRAMEAKTTLADTHPALSERLSAIGQAPRLALPEPGNAADRLLGPSLNAITEALDRRWKENILPGWEERHREVREARKKLADLNARHAGGAELSLRDAYNRATLTGTVGGDANAALEQFRKLHERAPDDPVVCFNLGAMLLARDDDSGRALVERAMQLDEDATLHVCEALRDYHWRNGRKDEARDWHRRLLERAQLQQAAAQERGRVLLKDKFEPHGLPDELSRQLLAELRTVSGLRKAYFVKKRVEHLAHRPCYVLGFKVTGPLRFHSGKRAAEVLKRIQRAVTFPGETLILNVEGENYRFGGKIGKVKGARIL